MANRIQYRRDTAANWSTVNPILGLGEPGYETDTGKRKIGDGATAWASLGYQLDKSATDAAYAPQNLPALLSGGRSWGFMGDSITNGSTAAAGRRYIDYLPVLVGTVSMATVAPLTIIPGAFVSYNGGVPGERSDQILARMDAMLANGVSGITLLAGTNDASQAVSTATFMANMDAIAKKCRKAGVPLVVGTVPPRSASTTASIRTSIAGYNLALRQWAPKNGVYLADAYSALVDISSGAMLAAYDSGDGTHPNTAGHYLLATAFATAVKRAIIPQTPIVTAKSVISLVSNPLFQSGSSGWFEQPGGTGTAPTYSNVADTTGRLPAGAQWREMFFDATAAGGTRTLATGLSAGWSVGDILLVAASIDVIDVSGYASAAKADPATGNFKLQVTNQSGVALAAQGNPPPLPVAPGDVAMLLQVPSGTTALNLWMVCTLPTGTSAKFRISAVDVRDLTTLGVTGY